MKTNETGPCVSCGAPHELYGPNGRPHCDTCYPRTAAYARNQQAVIRPANPVPLAVPRMIPDPEPESELSLF